MKERFVEYEGYKFDKVITRCFFAFVFVLGALTIWQEGGFFKNHIYVHCPSNPGVQFGNGFEMVGAQCFNPFFLQCDVAPTICDREYLPSGFEYGQKPGWLFNAWPLLIMGAAVLAAFINHFAHNRRWRK